MHTSVVNLTYGAEYEILSPLSREALGIKITALTGISVWTGSSYDAPSGMWKIVSDGSIELRGFRGHPVEVVSPIFRGQIGLDQIKKVLDALTAIGCQTNTSTGHHVHVGQPTQNLSFFKDLIKLYGRYEEAIDSLMPPSRRANGAYYAKTVRSVRREQIDATRSLTQLASVVMYSSGASTPKYHKVNLVPHGKPTVEFRQHSGTVDATKSINWINTCLRLVALANEGKIGEGTAERVAWDLARLAGKQAHCAQLIARPEGATNEEIRLAFGYRTISARTNLKRAGLPFREVRDRRTGKSRFFAVSHEVAVQGGAPHYPATLEGLADLLEASPEQRSYLTSRRAAVAR